MPSLIRLATMECDLHEMQQGGVRYLVVVL